MAHQNSSNRSQFFVCFGAVRLACLAHSGKTSTSDKLKLARVMVTPTDGRTLC
jgi:hypothetical protein